MPDGVLLAGDIYDKSVPSAGAVELFDRFLTRLTGLGTQVLVISGNHDSPERLAFGRRLMDGSGVHIAPVYNGHVEPVVLEDEFGPVRFYLLPFVKPAQVRPYFPEVEIASYTDALRCAVEEMGVDTEVRNVLVTHQFVTGASRSDSEERSVGGSDNVDGAVFAGFDYVALGHLHAPQSVGGEHIRYAGSPLKYSLSESKQKKSLTVAELGRKGELTLRQIPLVPRHDLVELRGSYEELTLRSYYQGTTLPEDFVGITLTDEEDIPDAIGKLRTIYHRLMSLRYDNRRTRSQGALELVEAPKMDPLMLFQDFYAQQNARPMTAEQIAYLRHIVEGAEEARK